MKRVAILCVAMLLIFTACTPNRQQQKPIELQEEKSMDEKGDLETNQSAIYDPGEVKYSRIIAEMVNVKAGTGNNFDTVGNLKKSDEVKVLEQIGNWYVIQMDNNQIGAIDAENATPIVKETDVQRVPQVQQPQQPQQQAQQQQTQQQPQAQQQNKVPQQTTTNKISNQEQQMVNLVNQERTKNGLSPLTVDFEVVRVAGIKSQDMADNNYFSHNSPTYGSPFDMMKNFGISYLNAGENLAGNSSVERAHTALMNSSGHRQNILSPNFTHIGIGVRASDQYGYLFTQLFISKPK